MLAEKEKLEDELKLLKESLELAVITPEEYETAKTRIDARLNDLDQKEEEEIEEQPKPVEEKEEPVEEVKHEAAKDEYVREEIKEEPVEEVKHEAAKDEYVREEIKEEAEEEQKTLEEVKEEKPAEEIKVEEKLAEGLKEEKKPEEIKPEEKPEEEVKVEEKLAEGIEEKPVDEEKKSSIKTIIYSAIFIVLILILYFFLFGGSSDAPVDMPVDEELLSFVACHTDSDCSKEGSIGACINPGEEDSECEYIEDASVKLTVLNNDCFNCDIGRVLAILNGFFLNIETENIDFETEEGKAIAEKFNIETLPAYIFNSSLPEAHDYYRFFSTFNKVGDGYVVKNTVANANYYIEREEIPNKLDLFVKQGQTASSKAEENLQEFLEVFEDDVDFEKHDEDDEIVKELGINTFPAFLINNKIKFSGVQSADKIRENFCQLNSVAECASELVKSLI